MSAAMQNSRNRNRSRQQPISGRGGYPSYRRETEQESSNSSPTRGLFSDPRTAMVMCSFMGTRTSVKTRNGSTYKGHTIAFSDKGDIAMTDAKLDDDDGIPNPTLSGIIIPRDKFVVCKTNGIDLKGLCSSSSDFTDSAIVGRVNGSSETPMKELQPWLDDDALETNSNLSLDDPNGGWDSHSMFQANKDKFNVQSTYNEDMTEYTTRLPEPGSEGYEERQKFAQKQAEEIERSEAYQNRISKELTDGDEESRYSAVHRPGEPGAMPHRLQESSVNSGKHNYPSQVGRGDSDQAMRNGTLRGPSRGIRQNSPYSSSAGHVQQHSQHHQSVPQPPRQMNSHYPGPPPSMGPLNRNQGPASLQSRQQVQQNHAGSPVHPHHPQQHPPQQYQQQQPAAAAQPPPPHPGMHQHQLPVSQQQQQQQPPPQHQRLPPHQQLVSPSGQHPSKPHPMHPLPQNVPPSLPSAPLSQQPPPQAQLPPPQQKVSPPQPQPPVQQQPLIVKATNINGPTGGPPSNHHFRQLSTEGKNGPPEMQKLPLVDVSQQVYHQKQQVQGHPSGPSSVGPPSAPGPVVDAQSMGQPSHSMATTSPPASLAPDRRVGRGVETSPEERNKIGQSLHDFKRNFVLESNGAGSQEPIRQADTAEGTPMSATPTSSSIASTPVSSVPEMVSQLTEQGVDMSLKADDKTEEETSLAQKSTLNPNAKEFKPKSQSIPMEAQSPSPQPRSSPLICGIHYPPQPAVLMPYQYIMTTNALNPQRKRATVSLGAGVVSDLTHQVTGQPLLATQPPNVMYIQAPGQPLPASYQLYPTQMINPRMVAPGSLTMAQTGQVAGLDQAASQNQPQPVFMTAQQPMPAPMPAHLHPQPAHAQAMPHPSSSHQAQPAHVPNPAPSPVQHQQHNSQPISQPLPHHMSQGPPQSATPQPAHYPQMTINYPAVPRTSMSGQQSMTTGHSSMSFMSAPQFAYNGTTTQYPFAPVPQPQTPQNSSHGAGPQTHQYVVMPQPTPQAHPPMQQHTAQSYTAAGIPFQSQHLMQGPPQMPPSHNPNPSQGSPHLIHPGMPAGMHQQVSGTQSTMYMQVPSTLQYHQQ